MALVDDFRTDEDVHVDLVSLDKQLRVTKIWPDDPRVTSSMDAPRVPPLDLALESRLSALLEEMPVWETYEIVSFADRLLRVGAFEYNTYNPGFDAELLFSDVSYLGLPIRWDGHFFRLALPEERTHVGALCEVSSADVVVKIVTRATRADLGNVPHFVVCADVQYRKLTK